MWFVHSNNATQWFRTLSLQPFRIKRSVLLLRMRNCKLSSVVLSPFKISTSFDVGVLSFDGFSLSCGGGVGSSAGVELMSAGSGDGETPRSCCATCIWNVWNMISLCHMIVGWYFKRGCFKTDLVEESLWCVLVEFETNLIGHERVRFE